MASTTAAKVAETSSTCPRCAKGLTDAAGLAWCSSCGYCKSLDEGSGKSLLPAAPAKPAPAAAAVQEAKQAMLQIPGWFYLLLTVALAIGAATIWLGSVLPAGGLPRAAWTTLLMGVGLFVIFISQIIVLVRVAPEDPQISFKDMFFPIRLWGHALKRTVTLRWPLTTAAWGLALSLSACVFIGGLGHWMTYLPGAKDGAKQNDKNKKVTREGRSF